ncbi:MAG: TIM barrel protein [Dorea sp.]
MKNNIELGVSLYGFTQRYVEEDGYGYEQMFQDLNKLGIKKFEVVGAQMFEHYPNPTDEEINEVVRLAKKYDVQPFSYGGYVDFAKYEDRDMNDDEMMNEVVFDLMTAHKHGCEYIRGFGIPVHLYERVAQMAEFYGVKVCYEIHAPERPSDPHIQELVKIFKKLQSPWVGFVPDFGCYIEKPNELHIQRFIELGAKRENLQFIIDNRWNGYTEEEMAKKMEEMGGGLAEKMAVSEWFGYMSFAPADIEGFKTVLPYAKYFHGKFYHIAEDCVETTIPYEKLLNLVVESGFDGTIMIEYEGHSFYLNDAVEQIGRHIEMEKRILGDN